MRIIICSFRDDFLFGSLSNPKSPNHTSEKDGVNMEEMKTVRRENLIAGLVGAFFGSLLGTACIVLLGQLGYVAALSGVVMAVCSLKGYEKLGGTLSRKGIIASCIMILLMTYLGNRLDWAISASQVLEISFLESYQAIPLLLKEEVIDGATYWGNLVLLYLFTLLGAVPTIYNALRGPHQVPLFDQNSDENGVSADLSSLTVYTVNQKWIRAHYTLTLLAAFSPFLMLFSIAFAPGAFLDNSWMLVLCLPLLLVAMILYLNLNIPFSQARIQIYARQDNLLWQVNLSELNRHWGYSLIRGRSIVRWDKLTPEQQQTCKQAIQYAIRSLQEQDSSRRNPLAQCVIPLREMQLVKTDKRFWTVQYETAKGRTKKLRIAKVYPELDIDPNMEPLEKSPPVNWVPMVLLIGCCLLPFVGAFLPEAPIKKTTYDLGSMHFQMEERMLEEEPGVYTDPDTETVYVIDPTPYAAVPEEIHPLLESNLQELQELFEARSSRFVAPEGELLEIEGPDGQVYLYDEFVYESSDNAVVLGYAVYLPQKECIVHINVILDKEPIEPVESRIRTMLRSLTVDADADLVSLSDITLTKENYQDFFAPAAEMGYEYVGRSFVKAPDGMFGEGSFADVYLPYSEDASYNEDGTMMSSRAHGVQLDVTLVHSTGTAAEVVESMAQQAFAAKNEAVNGEPVFDEELNMAVWVATHQENGTAVPLLFYADPKTTEYYLTAVITYYPSEQDEFSDALIEELSDAYGLGLPTLSGLSGIAA